jgi:hypothetical protein
MVTEERTQILIENMKNGLAVYAERNKGQLP